MMSRKRFLALPALVLAVGLVAGPADASRQDSWLGNPFMWHTNDLIMYPHRAAQDDWQNSASAVFVPSTSGYILPEPRGFLEGRELVQGTATFGRDNWGIIIAANDNRAYNAVKNLGAGYNPLGFTMGAPRFPDARRPAEYLVLPTSGFFTTWGLDDGFDVLPRTRMQVGFGYGLASLDLGLFWTNAAAKWTAEDDDGAGTVTKTGSEASYNSFTVSANLPTLSAFKSFEIAASFSTGSQEQFGDALDPDTGDGDNSSFGINWQGHLDTTWLGFTPAFNATYAMCSATWNQALDPSETAPTPEDKLDSTTMRFDFGGTRDWGSAQLAVNLGFQYDKFEQESTLGGGSLASSTETLSYSLFPVCGASGTYWARPWFGIDGGVLFLFDGIEVKDEGTDGAGASLGTFTENHQEMATELGFGLVFRLDRDTWGADFSATLHNDVLGNPGSLFQSDGISQPVVAFESALRW